MSGPKKQPNISPPQPQPQKPGSLAEAVEAYMRTRGKPGRWVRVKVIWGK